MPTPDDEKKLGSNSPEVIKVFDWERKPIALRKALMRLWIDRFGDGSVKNLGTATWYSWEDQPGLYLALEHLRRTKQIPDNPIFDLTGRLRKDAHEHDVEMIFGPEGILKGKKVMVFGGPEAEVFQAMGAHAVGFDPALARTDVYNLLSSRYDRDVDSLDGLSRETLHGWADLTYSYNLFDPGSGLVGTAELRRDSYRDMLGIVMALAKPEGLSIHNGNGMVPAVHPEHDRGFSIYDSLGLGTRGFLNLDLKRDFSAGTVSGKVLEIAPVSSLKGFGDPDNTYILQRKAT